MSKSQISTTQELLTCLAYIDPELVIWAREKDQLGWDVDSIIARLRAIAFIARPSDMIRADDFTVGVSIPARMIADLLVTAMEGGSGYWIASAKPNDTWVQPTKKENGYTTTWYDDEVFVGSDHFSFTLIADEDPLPRVVDTAAIYRGLAKMAEKSPKHFADIIADNHDADTADVFLQWVALGEIIYG